MFQWKTPVFAACAAGLLATVSTAAFADKDTRDVVHNSSGKVVVNSFGNCVRTQWVNPQGDECAPDAAQQETKAVSAARNLKKEERTVYFEFDKYRLTAESKQKLDSLANVLKSDAEVKSATIVGYADPIGTKAYNEQLSKRRALAVQNYLVSRGYLNTNMTNTRWLGEDSPKASCPTKMPRKERIACLQPDRRVEMEIDFYPEGAARPAAPAPAAKPAPAAAPRK